jgi:hypothetical protein
MRSLLTSNWPKYFHQVIGNLNNSPQAHIGGLKPALISSPLQNFLIDDRIGPWDKNPNYLEQIENQRKYLRQTNVLQPGDFVLLDYPKKSI